MNAVSIVVFAFNEQSNCKPVLHELFAYLSTQGYQSEVVFVDDGSTDGTYDEAMALASELREPSVVYKVIRRPINEGIGASLKTGVDACSHDWVTFLPADGQVPPDAVTILYDAALDQHAEVVFSLYKNRDDGKWRKLLSWGVRVLIWLTHGVSLKSEGPYIFRRPLFDTQQLYSNTFFLNFEFPIRALRAKHKTATVKVDCRKRLSGHSKSTGLSRIVGVTKELFALRGKL